MVPNPVRYGGWDSPGVGIYDIVMGDALTTLFESLVRIGRRVVWFVALVVALPLSLPAQTATEYEAKTALLFNFIKFVSWPESADTDRRDFVIASPADTAFGTSLKSLDGKRVSGREVRLVHYDEGQLPNVCDVIVVNLPTWDNLPDVERTKLTAAHVLTVSEAAEFTRHDGVLALFLLDDRLAFDINVEAAQSAELEISANLLNLARSLRNGGGR